MDARAKGLGSLAVLPDELLDHLLREQDARTLGRLSCVSKVFNIFCTEEPLWLELHLARCKQPFEYKVALDLAPAEATVRHAAPQKLFDDQWVRSFAGFLAGDVFGMQSRLPHAGLHSSGTPAPFSSTGLLIHVPVQVRIVTMPFVFHVGWHGQHRAAPASSVCP
jgi:hypothetical protein